MRAPSKGDVIVAFFPQEDRSAFDLRPCLVLSIQGDHLLAAKITTTELRQFWAYKLDKGKTSTSRGCIQKDSWVNLRRCEMIPIHDVKRIVATLKSEIFKTICEKLAETIGL
jgi:mRNA-degrading endonuclease toxin of MazEF toxin-antitoxin module